MPTRIDTATLRSLGREFARLAADSPKEIRRAVADIGKNANTEARRSIAGGKGTSGVYNITQARVQKGLTVSAGNLKVTITGENRPINAVSYKGTKFQKRKGSKGLTFQPLKGGKTAVFKRGFVVNKKSKDGGSNYAAQRLGDERLPIKGIAGPSVADMLLNPKVSDPLTTALLGRAATELTRRLARLRGT